MQLFWGSIWGRKLLLIAFGWGQGFGRGKFGNDTFERLGRHINELVIPFTFSSLLIKIAISKPIVSSRASKKWSWHLLFFFFLLLLNLSLITLIYSVCLLTSASSCAPLILSQSTLKWGWILTLLRIFWQMHRFAAWVRICALLTIMKKGRLHHVKLEGNTLRRRYAVLLVLVHASDGLSSIRGWRLVDNLESQLLNG